MRRIVLRNPAAPRETHCAFTCGVFLRLGGQDAQVVVLTFLRVEEHIELASEELFAHELALDLRSPPQAQI